MKTVALGALLLLLAACAGGTGAPPAPTATATGTPTGAPAATAPATATPAAPTATVTATARPTQGPALVGVLAGDAGLEGGCLWLEVGGERYELVAAAGSGILVDGASSTVTGADGTVHVPGVQVRVEGAVDDTLASFCQVGPILVVDGISAV